MLGHSLDAHKLSASQQGDQVGIHWPQVETQEIKASRTLCNSFMTTDSLHWCRENNVSLWSFNFK